MHIGVADALLVGAAVLVGSIVQGSLGLGLNIIAAPFVALTVPEALPATIVILALPIAVTTLMREHHALDRVALPWMLLGVVPGTLIGLLIIHAADLQTLTVIVAATVLIGVLVSIVTPPVPTNRATALAAGFFSNVFGTATGVGGPPVGLLFQHRTGPVARATLGAFFTTSASLSLVGYAATGELEGDQVLFALALAPIVVLGLWASRHFHVHVDGGWLRPAVLAISAVAGLSALIRALT
jgi:uncharacterized membrane protein YfcA